MADSTTNLDLISSGQSAKEVTANELFDAGSPSATLGRRASTTAGLTWGYYGGVVRLDSGSLHQIANGTKTLTNNATNFLELDTTDGSVDLNTSSFTAGKVPLYEIIVASGAVTSYQDMRALYGAAGTGGTDAADVAVDDAGGHFTGADVEAVLQEIGATLATLSGTADVDTDEVYTSDTGSTADSDPGNGLFKWNNATQPSATALYVDNQTAAGVSLTTFFASLPPDGYIHLAQEDDATKWQLWKWSGLPTAGSGYYKFTGLTLMASGGSIADDKSTSVSFKGTPPTTQPFDVLAFYPGIPTASAKVCRVPIARAVTFAANFAGSYFTASANATGTTVFDVQKNGSSIGSVSIAAGSTTATFTTSGGTLKSFAAGDVLALIAPGTPDATLADVGFAFAGTR
jgi:hypothetical protein